MVSVPATVPGSLSEGAAERSEAEGVYYDERRRSKIQSFVGAMKIARNVAIFGRYDEWYGPIPGSLSEGAVERMRD